MAPRDCCLDGNKSSSRNSASSIGPMLEQLEPRLLLSAYFPTEVLASVDSGECRFEAITLAGSEPAASQAPGIHMNDTHLDVPFGARDLSLGKVADSADSPQAPAEMQAIKVYRLRNSTWAWTILWNHSNGWQGEGTGNKYVYIDDNSSVKIRIEGGGGSFPYRYQLMTTNQGSEDVDSSTISYDFAWYKEDNFYAFVDNDGHGWFYVQDVALPPEAPSDLEATPDETPRVHLTWTDESHNETGFRIERKVRGGSYSPLDEVGANNQGYWDYSVVAGTEYKYRIQAYNGAGSSSWEYSDYVQVPEANVPPTLNLALPSSNVTVTQGDLVTIRWTDSDPDDNANISLARDPDTSSTPWSDSDHTWLTVSLREDPDGDGDQYIWDTTGVPPETYSVWGMIYDGTNPEVYDRAAGLVTIEEDDPLSGTVDGHAVSIQRRDAPSQAVDPTVRTWLVIHGMNSNPTRFDDLAGVIYSEWGGDQVLTLDWTDAADSIPNLWHSEGHILDVAVWATNALTSYGFTGTLLNLVGHSHGSYVAAEIAERIVGGVNTIVGLDPAENVLGNDYNPEDPGQIDFGGDNSRFSWAFSDAGGLFGSEITPGSADEAFAVENTGHSEVVELFTNMLNGVGSADVLTHFALTRLLGHTAGPWVLDQYDFNGNASAAGSYEAVINADAGGTTAQSIVFVPGDDNYEENDTLETAADPEDDNGNWEQTWLSAINGPGIQDDDDWYLINITSGYEHLVVDLTFSHAEGDIDLAVHDTVGVRVDKSDSITDNEHIDTILPSSGTYYIRVYYDDAGNTYDLWWDDLQPPNQAPVLDNTGSMTLPSINEDDFTNPGSLVSDIIASAGGDRITDANGDPEGIAVVGVDNADGSWQFSINGGGSWVSLASVSTSNARLLAANLNTRIRFVPDPDFNGVISSGITFRAWDQTSGSNGGPADTSNNGGTTAFSAATETASITVDPVNDAPTIGSLSDDPDPVTQGQTLILTANGVNDDHGVASVSFYRDANSNGVGDPGELLGTDLSVSGGWVWSDTVTWDPGPHTYLAQVTDDGVPVPVLRSDWASTSGTVEGHLLSVYQSAINPANGHLYHVITGSNDSAVTWTDAENEAVALGGHLATINDAPENAWVTSTFAGNYLWIGLNDAASEGDFVWPSGEPVTYTNWWPGEPNDYDGGEDYVHIYNFPGGNYQWNDSKDIADDKWGLVEVEPSEPLVPIVVQSEVNPANGHAYHLLKMNDGVLGVSWTEAENKAIELGGHLVTINDAAEDAWITSTFFQEADLWIGLSDAASEGDFVWASGDPVTYTNWQPGEPNNWKGSEHYVHISAGSNGRWNDNRNLLFAAVVEVLGDTEVVGRYVFYNNSVFDGNDPAANAADGRAIASDKTALLPGGTPGSENQTSYSRGINGLMIDIDGLGGGVTEDDFGFQVNSAEDPNTWVAAPSPASVTVRGSAGVGGSDRITIIWVDNAIENQWLRVTVLSNENGGSLGLAENDVFYIGNLIADSNGDGDVGTEDYYTLMNHFGQAGRGPVAYEGFAYAAGSSLNDQNGGYGWLGPWGADESAYTVTASGKTYSDGIGNSLPVAGFSLHVDNSYTGFRDIDASLWPETHKTSIAQDSYVLGKAGAEIWISFLGGPSPGWQYEYEGVSLFNGTSETLFMGDAFDPFTYGFHNHVSGAIDTTDIWVGNECLFLVRLLWNATGDSVTADMWLDPRLDGQGFLAELPAESVASVTSPAFYFDRIRIAGNLECEWDEIRLGTSYADVVPEPALAVSADFNRDRRIDLVDFAIMRGNFGNVLPALVPAAAPAVSPPAAGSELELDVLSGSTKVAAAASAGPEIATVEALAPLDVKAQRLAIGNWQLALRQAQDRTTVGDGNGMTANGKTLAPRDVKAAPGRRSPNNDAAAGIDLLGGSLLALSGSKGSAGGYISGAQAISVGSPATMLYREATGEYDLRPLSDDPATGGEGDLLVDVLEEAALAGQL